MKKSYEKQVLGKLLRLWENKDNIGSSLHLPGTGRTDKID